MKLRILLVAAILPLSLQIHAEDRPNIILIMVDDLGWKDLRCQGNDQLDTPNIDRFFNQGMHFTDAYSASPVCSPTRAALITGQSPARLGITQHGPNDDRFGPENKVIREAQTSGALPLDQVTVAERLKSKGYATAFIGKWHLSDTRTRESKGKDDPAFWPDHQGFDINLGGCGKGGPPTYFDPYKIPSLPDRKKGEYLTNRLTDEANNWIKAHAEQPFFLCLWTYNVHWPFEAPEELITKYKARIADGGAINPIYAAQIEATDIAIGKVLEQLEKLNLANNTLVIFTSDNGGWTGATDNRPLCEGKGHLYEGGMRVPLAIRWPGITKANTTSQTPVVSMDLTATILDASGNLASHDRPLDGETLRPILTQSGPLKRDALCFHYPHYAFHGNNHPGGAIRKGNYKLIERFADNGIELYDLAADLGESRNIADEHPELAAELLKDLHAWQKEIGAKMPERIK